MKQPFPPFPLPAFISMWNFLQFYQFPKPEKEGATFITKSGDYSGTHNRKKVSYTIRHDVKVVMHFTEKVPEQFTVRVVGVQK